MSEKNYFYAYPEMNNSISIRVNETCVIVFRFPKIAGFVKFNSVRSIMYEARMHYLPANPQDIYNLSNSIHLYDLPENVIVKTVVADDGSHHIIIINKGMLGYLNEATELFVDGTFKVRCT